MPTKSKGKLDAIALLKGDHKKVKALFAQLDELGERAAAARAKLFAQIDHELAVHTLVEETIFYPAFKARTKSYTEERDDVLEAYEEHAGAKALLAKLEKLDPKDETYKAKLTVLTEQVKHHIKEEESSLFPMARELLSADELDELGGRILEKKGQQPA
jgi:hemerythrin-like domain-containing protein